MRTRLWLLPAVLLVAAFVGIISWLHRREAAARRLAAWNEQKAEDAARALLQRPVTLSGGRQLLQRGIKLRGGPMSLRQFADLVQRVSDLPVELDEPPIVAESQGRSASTIQVQVPVGTFSLHTVFRLVLEPRGLCVDVQGQRLVITTLGNSTDRTALRTVVYPLPQPDPAGMDEDAWREVIMTNVEPGRWNGFGGPGHIEAVPGALVVVQTADAHRSIRLIVDTLSHLDETNPKTVLLPPRGPDSVETHIQSVLDGPTHIDFIEMPLKETIQYIAEQHSIPIILMSQKLKDAGVHLDTPITKNLHGISLRSALHLMLKDLELTFLVRDEALIITTPEDAESRLSSIVYPVYDLIATREGHDFDSLIALVTSTAAPQSWDNVGGPGSLLGIGDGWLLVQQTDYVHEQVAHLLNQLHRMLTSDDPPSVLSAVSESSAEQAISAALERPIALDFRNMPLKDALDLLQSALHVPIVLAAKKLEEAGVYPDARVTAPPGRAAQQLQSMLEPLKLTYIIRDEVLQITTPEDAESHLLTRVYDARPLLVPLAPAGDLRTLIESRVAPQSWDETGGPGSIEQFRGLLVVRQTADNHREVARLLNTLGTGTKDPSQAEDKQ